MSTTEDQSSSYEVQSAAHRSSFSHKKENQKETCTRHCHNQAQKHPKFSKNELEALHHR